MPFSFPESPTVGQQSTQNGRVYSWTGRVWRLVSAVLASHASTHASGGSDALTANQIGAAAKAEIYDFTRGAKPASATGSGGSYSWSIPTNAKAIRVYAIGGGGGGGSGRRGAAGTARFGGGGASSAGLLDVYLTASDFSSGASVSVSVGAGGPGGAAVTADDTNGNNGQNGGATSVTIGGKTFAAGAGGGASGGSSASGSAGNPLTSQFAGNAGGNSSATAAPGLVSWANSQITICAPGGGGGGGISTGNTSYNGGQTRQDAGYNTSTSANPLNGGTAPGGAGNSGNANSFGFPLPGGSGTGGGAGDSSTTGGAGGDGADYGGGGGGGGAAVNGFASGKGGNGGNGFLRITVWY